MFGRRKKDQVDEVAEVDAAPDEQEAPAAPARPQGPWDEADAPDDEVDRIDLGGLLVPVPADTEVRVDVSPEGEVVAATLVKAGSSMQVNAFAAPRSAGIWDEVRTEIGEALRAGGGSAQDTEGPWGVELQASVPTQVPGQALGFQPARFIGVDGPRWFVRALVTGPAASDRALAADLEAALRDVLVVRGGDPMAVRDPLPLRLPKQVADAAAAEQEQADLEQADQEQADQEQAPSLQMQERGPEITELR